MKHKPELGTNSTLELIRFLTKTKSARTAQSSTPLGKLNVLLDLIKDSNEGVLENVSNRQIFLSLTNEEIKYKYDFFNEALNKLKSYGWITVNKSNEKVVITINPIFKNKYSIEVLSNLLEKKITFAPLALFVDFIAITDENGHYQSDKLFIDIYEKAKKPENTNCFRYMKKLCDTGFVTKHAKLNYSYDNNYWR
nr:hypothetical protein [Moritella viscosa]SHO15765.1 Sugar fermentation stimulation protein homolog [Moritella viscosa]